MSEADVLFWILVPVLKGRILTYASSSQTKSEHEQRKQAQSITQAEELFTIASP